MMETIYNHNPTDYELRQIFGIALSRDEYMLLSLDPNTIADHLFYLFVLRGDTERAEGYLLQHD